MCNHPPKHLYSWYARNDSAPQGKVLVIVCKKCHTILKGSAS